MKAIVLGAGIGGLTAALCLHRAGWDIDLVERAPALTEVGAGIQIGPNGMKVMRALGLEDALLATGTRPDRLKVRDARSGKRLFERALGAADRRLWGAETLHIYRPDLIRVLADAVETRLPRSPMLGVAASAYGQNDAVAWLELEDGTRCEADVVIAADGARSAVRRQMLPGSVLQTLGCHAWRAVVPADRLAGGALAEPGLWLTRGGHAVTYTLRDGALVNLVAVVEREPVEGLSQDEARAAALADLRDWYPPLRDLLAAAETVTGWPLAMMKPLDRWHDGRVALLGDAAHPMLPFLAQGAVQAMEDAYVLADRVAIGGGDIAGALRAYGDARRPRTARVQAASYANRAFFHRPRLPVPQATGGVLARLAGGRDPLAAQFKWLYGHDVTEASIDAATMA